MNVRQLKSGSYNYRMMKDGVLISFTTKEQITSKKEIEQRFWMAFCEKQRSEASNDLPQTPIFLKHKREPRTGYVYFISNGAGAIKVGRTSDVENRLKDLQTSNPHKLEVIKTFEYKGSGSLKGERFWQAVIRRHFNSLSGEWFEAEAEDVLKVISDYQDLEVNGCQR